MPNNSLIPHWPDVSYGVPQPRFIKPLVRINGMVEDAPHGYKIDPCYLPPTILQLDVCGFLLRVNDAIIDLEPMLICFRDGLAPLEGEVLLTSDNAGLVPIGRLYGPAETRPAGATEPVYTCSGNGGQAILGYGFAASGPGHTVDLTFCGLIPTVAPVYAINP
jgi:hypothetical protein